MRPRRVRAAITGALLLGGCAGGDPAPPQAKPAPPMATPATSPPGPTAATTVRPLDPGAGPVLPPMAYDAKGRPDPFVPVSLTVEAKGINVTAARLVGIIRGGQGTLALVEGADGVGYILKSGDTLGNGRVIGMTATTVTFAVSAQPGQGPTTVTLRLVFD